MEIQIQNPTFISTRLHHSHNKSKNLLFFRLAKKKGIFFTYDFITNDNSKEIYRLHDENDDDPDADFTQLIMGLCIGLPSRQILIKNLIFLFWCSIWGMKCFAKYCCQNFVGDETTWCCFLVDQCFEFNYDQ